MEKPERLSLQSADGVQLNLDALYQIAPSCFTEAADPKTGGVKRVVNFDVLRQLLGDDAVEDAPEAYEFNWVGKQAARAEVLRPINKTLRPVKEDSVDWDTTQNLYIEGDNLEVLKLLQKSYLGKVKMIYIDPPYNTGNDFVYHDDFARSQKEEDKAAGNVDELGNRFIKNTDSNGRYHSDWCSMIYSRLMVANTLLREDGVIFISIDDNEVRNLRNICDEVFGANNFVAQFIWKSRQNKDNRNVTGVSIDHEYILAYSKTAGVRALKGAERITDAYKNPDNDPRGPWTSANMVGLLSEDLRPNCHYDLINPNTGINYGKPKMGWRYDKHTMKKLIEEDRILWPSDSSGRPRRKSFLSEISEIRPGYSSLVGIDIYTRNATLEVEKDMGDRYFDFPKPSELIRSFIEQSSDENDIVLDFFSGSATTASSVFQQNAIDKKLRKFILVQLPETTEENSVPYKAGYKTICDIAKDRIRRVGNRIKEDSPLTTQDLDTGFRVFRVDSSNYEEVEHAPKEWNQDQLDLFLDNIKSDRTDLDLLFGCMLDWGVQLSLPMTTEEVDGKKIYTVNEGDLVACFDDKVTDNVVRAMAEKQPLRVIFRDSCFERDADKINIYETFKQLMDWSDQEVVKNIRVI